VVSTIYPIDSTVAGYIADTVAEIQRLNVKITAAAEIAARFHGLSAGDVKLSEDFKSLVVTKEQAQ
jgi:hypothetical protein